MTEKEIVFTVWILIFLFGIFMLSRRYNELRRKRTANPETCSKRDYLYGGCQFHNPWLGVCLREKVDG